MDNSTVQSFLVGVVGINTLATFSVAFFVGLSWGDLIRWRAGIDKTVADHAAEIEALRKAEAAAAVQDAQLVRQGELIKALGQRTHDLRNILTASALVPPGREMKGFDQPISGGGD